MSIIKQNALKVSELKRVVRQLANNDLLGTVSVYISGPPGIGKTALFEQMAKEIEAGYEVFLTATMDPTDVCGVPMAMGDMTRFLPPERLMRLTNKYPSDVPTIATFEDLPACSEQVFAALFRLFHEREVGGYKIRDNVLMCATGNRSEDRAGAQELPTALANRFVHFEQLVDTEEWSQWAMMNGIDPMVIAFVSQTGGSKYLHKFDPNAGDPCFASPRSVAKASVLYKAFQGYDREMVAALAGSCGEDWANGFLTFHKLREKMIPIKEILENPDKVKTPKEEEIDLTFVTISNLVCAILDRLSDPNTDVRNKAVAAGLTYACRLPAKDMGMKLAHNVLFVLKQKSEFANFFQSPIGIESLKATQKELGKFKFLD